MVNDDRFLPNKQQRKAVEHHAGPLLLIAGAGTGKTTVIVEKIAFLIEKELAKPEQIAALTFTEKAAAEMVDRVDQVIPYGYFPLWISTFHSFADQILKEEISQIGLSPGYRLMPEAETIIFLRKNLFLFNLSYFRPLGNPHKFLEALLTHFSRLKDEDISPDEYRTWAKNITSSNEEKDRYQELANAYDTYQTVKIKEGLMDFSDLIFYLLRLFRRRKTVLKKYQEIFRYVLVDEFQDTNIAQYNLIKLLCPPKKHPCLTVVGDDSQAIYKFRGASVSNILMFMKEYPSAKQITLKDNYRSNQTILDKSYRLIKNNDPDTLEAKLGISKNLIGQKKGDKDSVEFFLSENVEEEADVVVKKILSLKKDYQYADFAILCRANNHADPFIRALTRAGVPYQFLGPGMLLKQPEVKDLVAYLKILANVEDSVSLYRVLAMDLFAIDAKDLHFLLAFSKKINLPFLQAIEIYLSFFEKDLQRLDFEIYKTHLPFLKPETRQKLLTIFLMIKKHLSLLKKETAGQILYYFLEQTRYLNVLVAYKSEREEKIALNISKFFGRLKNYEAEHEDASVPAVVEYLDMSMELGESPATAKTNITLFNAVNVLTVHAAKGLEFPIVFLVNLTYNRFPTREKKEIIPIPTQLIKELLPEGDYHLEEERRLFYVGLTRAKDKVVLTSSRFYGEGVRPQKLSPFAVETLGKEFLDKYRAIKKEEKQQLTIFDFKKNPEIIPKQPLAVNFFSYTQLETYDRCPLQYKYQFVLKVPTAPGAALSFGDTIHKTLQRFYQEFAKDTGVGKQQLLETYAKNWNPVGYSSAAHEVRMKKEGVGMLKKFLKTFHRQDLAIIGLEKLFKVKIGADISIVGKIDRIDDLGDGRIEIIDYKTGKKPDEKALKKNFQLSIYALAATDPGLYRKNIDKVHLTFYYLQDMEKISLQKTATDIANVKKNIVEKTAQIRTGEFTPRVGPWCDFCPFRMICEAWQ